MTNHTPAQPPITEKQAADMIGCSVSLLRKGRMDKGPLAALPYLKLGRAVRYVPADVVAFLGRHRVGGEAA